MITNANDQSSCFCLKNFKTCKPNNLKEFFIKCLYMPLQKVSELEAMWKTIHLLNTNLMELSTVFLALLVKGTPIRPLFMES